MANVGMLKALASLELRVHPESGCLHFKFMVLRFWGIYFFLAYRHAILSKNFLELTLL